MLVMMKETSGDYEVHQLTGLLADCGVAVTRLERREGRPLLLRGNLKAVDATMLCRQPGVAAVRPTAGSYPLASRMVEPADTVVRIGQCQIGGGHKAVIAGPCSVESEEQMIHTAQLVKEYGAMMLRGGAYKPRSSPYSFQGLGEDGLALLAAARQATGLPFVTEVMGVETFDVVEEYADLIQIGARNMQNFPLLKRAAQSSRPILLKRGLSATLDEFLMAAEYIMAEGKTDIILCERGIRSFDSYTRNTLDISIIPAIKERSHLPIIVDPSHACGHWAMVEPLAKAAMAAGADGLMIEVHHQPEQALCDGEQSLKPERFGALMDSLQRLMVAV